MYVIYKFCRGLDTPDLHCTALIVKGSEYGGIGGKPCPNVTLSTTNCICTALVSNPGLPSEKAAINTFDTFLEGKDKWARIRSVTSIYGQVWAWMELTPPRLHNMVFNCAHRQLYRFLTCLSNSRRRIWITRNVVTCQLTKVVSCQTV